MQKPNHPDEIGPLFVERANAGDVDGLVALYEPDAVLAVGAGAMARGAVEIRAFYAGLLDKGIRFVLGRQQPALIQGNIALTCTMLSDGTITVEVARKQADGSWRWAADNPSLAAFWSAPKAD